VLTHHARGDGAQSRGCKICMHVMQNASVVEEHVMGEHGEFFGWRKMLISPQIELKLSDLMSEVRAFAYEACNDDAYSEAPLFACIILLVLGVKLYVFGYCSELAKILYCMS
jgi:hypothetical protein